MVLWFSIVEQVLLVGSLLLLISAVVFYTVRDPDPNERLRRIIGLAVGALIAVGAQASGGSYATFTVTALSTARPASAAAKLGAIVVPGLLGAGIGFFFNRKFRSSSRVAIRLMGAISMLATIAFLQIYITAAAKNGATLGASAIPNVAFVAGVLLTYILIDDQKTGRSTGIANTLLGALAHKAASGGPHGKTDFMQDDDHRDPFA